MCFEKSVSSQTHWVCILTARWSELEGKKMEYVILHHNKSAHLHALENGQLSLLGPVPGLKDASYSIATDNATFAFIDQAFKRIGFYKILPAAPYYEALISPTTLPKNCRANCLLIHHQTLYVGGNGKEGCLWKIEAGQKDWVPLPLPDQLAEKSNKSIEILFVEGEQLIAVDSLGHPKSILTYDIKDFQNKPLQQIFKLQSHYTKYESVLLGASNKDFIAFFSIGFMHGEACYFLSLLNKHTLKEIWTWSTSVSHIDKGYDHYIINDNLKSILGFDFLPYYLNDDTNDTKLDDQLSISNQCENESGSYPYYRDKRLKHTSDELVEIFNSVMNELPSFFSDELGMDMTKILQAEKLFDQYEPWRKTLCSYDDDALEKRCYELKKEKEVLVKESINKLRYKKYITRVSSDPEYLPRAQLTSIDFLGNYLLLTTVNKLFKFDIVCFVRVNKNSVKIIAFHPVLLKKVRIIERMIKLHHNQDEVIIFGYDKSNQAVHEVVKISEDGE
jgi:hypothetical protein